MAPHRTNVGITPNGKKNINFGIEAGVMSEPQIMKFFADELAKIISIDLEAVAKFREMKTLNTAMQSFALKKLQIGGNI